MRKNQIRVLITFFLCLILFNVSGANGEEKVKTVLVKEASQQKTINEIDAVKIYVPSDGLYKVTYRQLKDLGLSPEEMDLYNTSLENMGKQYPFLVIGYDKDNSFDRGDYIVFYGRRPHGINTWRNKYTDDNIYRLEFNRKGIVNQEKVFNPGEAQLPRATGPFFRTVHLEQDNAFERFAHPTGVDTDYTFWLPIVWIMGKNHRFINFNLPGLQQGQGVGYKCTVRSYLYGRSDEFVSGAYDHNMKFSVNGYPLGEKQWNGYKQMLFEKKDVPVNVFLPQANEMDFDLIHVDGIKIDYNFLDWVEVKYPVSPEAINNALDFTVEAGYYKQTREIDISKFSTDKVYLYNVSQNMFIKPAVKKTSDGHYEATFSAEQAQTQAYFMASETALLSPSQLKISRYMGLKSKNNAANYIIVSHEDFLGPAERLLKYRNKRGAVGKLVPLKAIYDEFNYSMPSPTAIKSFLAYAYNNWKSPQLKYVLLMGDWSWDWHNIENSQKQNFVPTWYVPHPKVEYATDSYFSSVDDDFIPELALGRLPVKNLSEADTTVNKLINYELNFTDDAWRHKILLTASAAEHFHTFCDELAADHLQNYVVEKAYCRADSPLLVTQRIIDACNEGIGLLLYAGHGSRYLWLTATSLGHTSDDLDYDFQPEKIDQINNPFTPPIVFAATCFTNNFDNPAPRNCIGEKFLIKENGGAIGVIASSSYSYIDNDKRFTQELFKGAFDQDLPYLGDIFLYASLHCSSEEAVKMFLLLGDPMSRRGLLPFPAGSVQVEGRNGNTSFKFY